MYGSCLQVATALCFLFAITAGTQVEERGRSPHKDLPVQKRFVCNSDNVLRALKRNTPYAKFYCQSLIGGYYQETSVVASPATPTAAIVTTTYTMTETVYPNGKHLESLPFPSYVSAYPASRVSSGCTCLLGPTTTITSTYPGATITSYTATTSTTTLTGLCATDIPYSGVFSLVSYDDTTAFVGASTTSSFGINPYQCCVSCQNVIEGFCVGYFAVPGVSCVILQAFIEASDPCSLGGLFSTSSVYPNNLGGTGPCASTIAVN